MSTARRAWQALDERRPGVTSFLFSICQLTTILERLHVRPKRNRLYPPPGAKAQRQRRTRHVTSLTLRAAWGSLGWAENRFDRLDGWVIITCAGEQWWCWLATPSNGDDAEGSMRLQSQFCACVSWVKQPNIPRLFSPDDD